MTCTFYIITVSNTDSATLRTSQIKMTLQKLEPISDQLLEILERKL
jgi:hypothetical protein